MAQRSHGFLRWVKGQEQALCAAQGSRLSMGGGCEIVACVAVGIAVCLCVLLYLRMNAFLCVFQMGSDHFCPRL